MQSKGVFHAVAVDQSAEWAAGDKSAIQINAELHITVAQQPVTIVTAEAQFHAERFLVIVGIGGNFHRRLPIFPDSKRSAQKPVTGQKETI